MAIFADDARQDAFFDALEGLIAEYPEITNGDPDDLADEITDGFDPSSPKMLAGLVLLLATNNVDGWSELTVLRPRNQLHYFTTGMLHQGLSLQ